MVAISATMTAGPEPTVDSTTSKNEVGNNQSTNKGSPKRPIDEGSTKRPLNKGSVIRPVFNDVMGSDSIIWPYYKGSSTSSFHSGTTKSPSYKSSTTSPLDKRPDIRQFVVPFTTSLQNWSATHTLQSIDWGFKPRHFDFERYMPPTPPPRRHFAFPVFRALMGIVGSFLLVLILAKIRKRKQNRRRRAVFVQVTEVTAAGEVEQDTPTSMSPFGKPELNPLNDLPPSYSECAPNSINHFTTEEPPTYTKDTELHEDKQQQNAFLENERRTNADSELVFDNGRVVQRLSLDLSGTNDTTGVAGDGNVQEQSTRQADLKDRVVYVDETDNVNVNTKK